MLAAARDVHKLIVPGEDTEAEDRALCISTFLAAGGGATIFRRQNAMGTTWREECKNGTMSLLSKISMAVPELDAELVRLNKEAEAQEIGCAADGRGGPGVVPPAPSPVIVEQPQSRAGRVRKQGARPLSGACNFASGTE